MYDSACQAEPLAPDGTNLTVASPLFDTLGQPIKLGAPHVVDHGPENVQSPDGALYMVGMGCLASKPNPNWPVLFALDLIC